MAENVIDLGEALRILFRVSERTENLILLAPTGAHRFAQRRLAMETASGAAVLQRKIKETMKGRQFNG
jgi:hypothetical protein